MTMRRSGSWSVIRWVVFGVCFTPEFNQYLPFTLENHAKTWFNYDNYKSPAGFWIRYFTCDIIILCIFDAGKVPGEEPSSHIYPETARFPRPSCNSQGEMGNAVWRWVTAIVIKDLSQEFISLFLLHFCYTFTEILANKCLPKKFNCHWTHLS